MISLSWKGREGGSGGEGGGGVSHFVGSKVSTPDPGSQPHRDKNDITSGQNAQKNCQKHNSPQLEPFHYQFYHQFSSFIFLIIGSAAERRGVF